jgi:signal transduction histidine kinase
MQERSNVRVPILGAVDARVLAQIETASGSSMGAKLVNISAHGIMIRSQNPIRFGEIVDCKITDQPSLKDLRLRAEARWSQYSPEDEYAYRVGLRVREFDGSAQEFWDEFRLSCLDEIEVIDLIDPSIALVSSGGTNFENLEGKYYRNILQLSQDFEATSLSFFMGGGGFRPEVDASVSRVPQVNSQLKLVELRKVLSETSEGIVVILKDGLPAGATSLRFCSIFFQEHYELMQCRARRMQGLERAVTAHELRGPLSIIKTTADLLLSPDVNFDEIRESGLVEGIRSKCEEGLQIADRFLEQSKTRKSQTERSKSDLARILRDVISEFRRDSTAKSIELVFEPANDMFFVFAAELDLIQAFRNIISNSIKYSRPDTKVVLTIAVFGNSLQTQVRDQGIGIPEQQIGRLFSAFGICGNQATGGEAQNGLGLFITKQLIEKNQGTIAIESKSGQGTVVSVTLPICLD